MPAYNAAETLRRTHEEVLAQEIVDLVIVVDDASQDETVGDRAHAAADPRRTSTRRIAATAATRRPAIGWRSSTAPTSSSWSTPTTSTRPS